MRLEDFPEVVFLDTEFTERVGECPQLICFVGYEQKSDRWMRFFADEEPHRAPFHKDALLVGYAISSDLTCLQSLGWQGRYYLDLFAEYRLHTNELGNKSNASLLAALDHFQIPHITSQQKDRMRQLAIRGGPFTDAERRDLLAYCQSDVQQLPTLFEKLIGPMDERQFAQALGRGRFVASVSSIEKNGIPVDVPTLKELEAKWDNLLLALIAEVDREYHIYDGVTFKFDRFSDYLSRQRITWPRTPKGRLKSDDDTLRAMALAYPILNPLRELRATLSTMKHWTLAVGADGRNRTSLRPFTTQTARNAPSNTLSIFGPACWLRGLIKPDPGYAVAYCDYEQEEFAVGAWLSGDENMLEAYRAGDVYLAFAKQVGAIPACGTKATHRQVRDQYKQVILAVGYGQQARGLALRLGCTETKAQILLDQHRELYKKFWAWSDRVLATMQLENQFTTRAGWRIKKTRKLTHHEERSLRNFPVQSTASSVLHVCSPMVTEAGIQVAMLVHDALLIVAPVEEIEDQIKKVQGLMAAASRLVLGGFELRTDAKPFVDRFMDERGESTWNLVMRLLKQCDPPQLQYRLFDPAGDERRLQTCGQPS
jgi:DNA polymerase-1